jgi:hypothetical protein
MSDLTGYSASLLTDNLGLPNGYLRPEDIPAELTDSVRSSIIEPPQAGFDSPVLDAAIQAFSRRLESAELERDGFSIRKARWPGGSRFAICLTHDVDNVSRPRSHILKVRKRFGGWEVFAALLGLTSLYNNMGAIARQEEARGFRSSFYLMSAEYPLSPQKLLVNSLMARGHEVGLHGDFGTHDSLEKMNEAVRRFQGELGFKPVGVREHYLKFDWKETWGVLERAGFDYDTTVGMADRVGFKVGLATPFHPPGEDYAPMRVLELPLTLMDTTLWGYLKEEEERGFDHVLEMMGKVEEAGGLFTLLWHQEAVRMRGGRIYWRLLDEFKRKGCFVGSGLEVANWWRARGVPLVRSGSLITLGGPPPKGLVLIVKARDGLKVTASSASVTRSGTDYLVSPADSSFRMEVAR